MENSVSRPLKFEWQSIIQKAVEESNPEKLRTTIADAESVIFRRLQTIGQDDSKNEELNALQAASDTLLNLKREALKFPDWRP